MVAELSSIAGLLGVAISMIAYLPQIIHLIREHCSAGISRLAFGLWLVSSVLITFHAVMIKDGVFVALGFVQIITSLIIYIYSTRYRTGVCMTHRRAFALLAEHKD